MNYAILVREIQWAFYNVFRLLVPRPDDREPVSWRTIPVFLASFLPFFFMAYLARRPNTYAIRLLLLPTVIFCTVGAGNHYTWLEPSLNVYNWSSGLYAMLVTIKAIGYAFTKEGMLKIGEKIPGQFEPEATKMNGDVSHSDEDEEEEEFTTVEFSLKRPMTSKRSRYLPRWCSDAVELMSSLRGIGWRFGQGVYVPPFTRSLQRPAFIRQTALSFVKEFIIVDFLETILKQFPGVGSPRGESIFYPELPPVYRYTVSTVIHIITGTVLLHGFQMVYDLLSLIGVALIGNEPSSWPPVMDNPWIADSLHIFWSKRWHQLLRRTFTVLGGYPGYWLAGKPGLILGSFLASGLYHELSMYGMNRGIDMRVVGIFVLQVPLLYLEKVWKMVTGRKVHGVFGVLWVYFCIMVLAQPMVDSWHKRGLAGAMVIPPIMSPTRKLLLPLLRDIYDRLPEDWKLQAIIRGLNISVNSVIREP